MDKVIEWNNLKKIYNSFVFFSKEFSIHKGQCVGVVGENGSGKTTLFNLLLNKVKRNEGQIFLFGKEISIADEEIKQNIGVVLDNSFFYEKLTVKDLESIHKSIYYHWDRDIFYKYINIFELPLNQKIGIFSKGMKRRLDISIALSHHAKLLILDEISNGLDLVTQKLVIKILKNELIKNKTTVLLSTHNMLEIKELIDIIVVLKNGSIVSTDCKQEITNYYIFEGTETELLKLNESYSIDCFVTTGNKVNALIKLNNKMQVIPNFSIRKAEIDEIIYLKLKGEHICMG